jgi:PHP domain
MDELTVNLHMHTTYSDGTGSHEDLARAALKTGVDVLLVTDHNTWVDGMEKYHRDGKKRVLLLVGEEIHDQARDPQKNHLLAFGAEGEFAPLAGVPQALINAVRLAGGLPFIAHPIDPALPIFDQDDISWVDWDVHGFTGIELWNGFSEFKTVVKNRLAAIFYAFFPEALAHEPLPEALALWDRLMKNQRVVAVGGSDAHALHTSLGPLRRVVFPYEYHFSAVNTHLLVPNPLLGDISRDKKMIFASLASGHCFVGYDLPASTRGFRFSAHNRSLNAVMGDEIPADGGVTLQVKFPSPPAEAYLLKDGKVVEKTRKEALTFTTSEPGVYRVEAYRKFLGRRRGWIFSNPVYIV